MASSNNGCGGRYGNSNFLRSSAIYGSNQPTVFNESSLSSHLRKTSADRSAIGGYQNPEMVTTYQLQAMQSASASRTNSPSRAQQQQQSSLYGRTTDGYGNTPTRRGGRATPERARSPNPITGEFLTFSSASRTGGGGGEGSVARQLGAGYGERRASPIRKGSNPTSSSLYGGNAGLTTNNNTNNNITNKSCGRPQQQDGYYYIDSQNGSRANSPTASVPPSSVGGQDNYNQNQYHSRTSSIGRRSSSSVGSAYGRNNNNNAHTVPAAGVPTAAASGAAGVRRENSFGKARVAQAANTRGMNNSKNNNNNYSVTDHSSVGRTTPTVVGSDAEVCRSNHNNDTTAVRVRRAAHPNAIIQNQNSFHISQCGPPASNPNATARSSSALRRESSAPRIDPAQMKPAGVSTPRQRFDESPHRTSSHRMVRDNRNAGNSEVGSLIFGGGGGAESAGSVSRTGSNSGTPTRARGLFGDKPSGVRRVEPPQPAEKNGLWVRTKNKDNIVHLGVKGRGAPPQDGKVDDSFSIGKKLILQPQNIKSAACQVVAEESEPKKAKHNPLPTKPYHGFVIPPYRVDKETLGKISADLEPEVFMEPFGRDYTRRRHFDPYDSVKTDIQHSHLSSTNSNNRVRGTALIAGKGTLESSKDILNLSKYTAEELGEKLTRHNFMVGPPAFVPDPVKPYAANVNYRPQRAGAINSPTNVSHLNFGTSSNVARAAADSPARASTPRGPRRGVYSPARDAPRPF